MLTLRPYQQHDLDRVRHEMRLHQAVLLVEPTGAGKGFSCAYIIHNAIAKGKRVIFLVNRRALVNDMSKRLTRLGIEHGVYMGTARSKPWLSVHVCSIDTLSRRQNPPAADLVILDEAHFCTSPTWLAVIQKYQNAKILGLTATPIRGDGQGLGRKHGGIFDSMVIGPSVMDLINDGYLVKSNVYSHGGPEITGKAPKKDWTDAQSAFMCNTNKLVGDIVRTWQQRASDRKTVVFGSDTKHAMHIAEQFRCKGIDFAYVDAGTNDKDREKIWDDFDNGNLRGVCSINTVSYGWDHPRCSCVVLARITNFLGLHLQQIGRGSRPYRGKENFLVHDHAGNCERLDAIYEDDREWSLDGANRRKTATEQEPPICTCKFCFGSFRGRRDKCPYCGRPVPKQYRSMVVQAGELKEFQRERKMLAREEWKAKLDDVGMRKQYEKFKEIGEQRGYKKTWARMRFKSIFQCDPPPPDVAQEGPLLADL